MLNQSGTRIGASFIRDVATGITVEQEGTLLVYAREGDKAVVQPSAGVSGEEVAGFAMSRLNSLTRMTSVFEGTVPVGGGDIVLPSAPTEQRVVSAGAALTEGAVADGNYQVNGSTLTFNAAQAGEAVVVNYAFVPNVQQASMLTGDAPVGGLASSALGTIGVIDRGDISTDQYDVEADWSAGLAVYTGANGLVTTNNSGTKLAGGIVLQAPAVGNAFVLISFR